MQSCTNFEHQCLVSLKVDWKRAQNLTFKTEKIHEQDKGKISRGDGGSNQKPSIGGYQHFLEQHKCKFSAEQDNGPLRRGRYPQHPWV